LKCPTCRMLWVENVDTHTQKVIVKDKEYVSIKHMLPKSIRRRSLSSKK